MLKFLILNGSISADQGNTQKLIEYAKELISSKNIECKIIQLKDLSDKKISIATIADDVFESDGIIFTTGTYWDSWGSPLQFFLESFTPYEGHQDIVGKPVSVIATMHSVGGKSILSRLQGVLNTMGFSIPPMSSIAYSLVNQEALENKSSFSDDFWSIDDLGPIVNNLATMAKIMQLHKNQFQAWPLDHKDPKRIWIKDL